MPWRTPSPSLLSSSSSPHPGALSSLSLQHARANPSSSQLASPPFRAAPRPADAAGRSAATPSTSSAQQRKPTGPESADSGPRPCRRPPPIAADSDLPRARRRHHQLRGELTVLTHPFALSLSSRSAPATRARVCRRASSLAGRLRRPLAGGAPAKWFPASPWHARANPSSGQLASPPFRAAPRPADAAGRSAATPSTSSAQQRKPTGPESAESGPARAAGPPPIAADSDLPRARRRHHQLRGELTVLTHPFALSLSLRSAPATRAASAAARARRRPAPATIGGRRPRQMVPRVALVLSPFSRASIRDQFGRLEIDQSSQGAHGRADVMLTSA
nr:uncharacterized protein LOC127315877 [Lolium perenne]